MRAARWVLVSAMLVMVPPAGASAQSSFSGLGSLGGSVPFSKALAVSPDGSSLAVALRTDTEPRLVVLPAGGGEARGLTTPSGHTIGSMAWTPDGRAILYPWPNLERRIWDVWRLALTGGDPEPIGLDTEAAIGQLRLHPDGRRLAEGDPYTFLHVVKPEIDLDPGIDPYDDRVYAQARDAFRGMIDRGWLVRDTGPALYVYLLETSGHRQTGIVGVLP